jgi:hypothetical protein
MSTSVMAKASTVVGVEQVPPPPLSCSPDILKGERNEYI